MHFHRLFLDERFVGIPTSYEDFFTGTASDSVNHGVQVIRGSTEVFKQAVAKAQRH